MPHRFLEKVDIEDLKKHLLKALNKYWMGNTDIVSGLPISRKKFPDIFGPLNLELIQLPAWADQYGVDGKIAVPSEACSSLDVDDWKNVDWWLAAFLMLECWHERAWELNHGPIHSYSFRLTGWDERVWEHAWVNRIALFLRAWAERLSSTPEEHLFHSLPEATFIMTHDVDAVTKTISIRFKQSAFNFFNACRGLLKGNPRAAGKHLGKSIAFLFSSEDWWTLDRLVDQERKADIRSCFNFFSDRRSKSIQRYLFDPNYDLFSPKIDEFIKNIYSAGWSIGLHPSFDSWEKPTLIKEQRKNLEESTGLEVTTCRQHWLRFSWESTWSAQQEAGIKLDTTLMFNDRPGFRAAASLQWEPWNPPSQSNHALEVLPTIFMDSHFYDYQINPDFERKMCMSLWFDEIKEVHGKAAFLWHPHTLTKDYGWQAGYDDLLSEMKKNRTLLS